MYRDKLFIFIVVLTSLLIIIHTVYNAQGANFFMDDYWWGMYTGYGFREKLFDSFKFDVVHGGGYPGLFLCKLFSFGLPNMLGLHPQDFMSVPQGIIRSILAIIILFFISTAFVRQSKNKPFYYLLFPFCTLYYLYSIYSCDSLWIKYSTITFVNYNWYRYFFSLFFFAVFWQYISEIIFTKEKNINYFKLICAVIAAYATATSSELLIGASCCAIGLIIIFDVLYSKKIILNRCFFIPASVLYITAYAFITTDKFSSVFLDRLPETVSIQMIIDFIKEYFKICFYHEIIFWAFFAALFIYALYTALKNKEKEKLLIPIVLQISVLTVMFLLIIPGKTFANEEMFWLQHPNVQFIYKMLIFIPFLMLFNYVTQNSKYSENLFIYSAVALFILVLTLIKFTDGLNILKYRTEDKKLRTQYYINEKILNYYYLKDKKPLLPSFLIASGLQYYSPVENGNDCYIDYILSDVYYSKIYKNDKPIVVGYCKTDIDKALEEFYKIGGSFSKEELTELKFQNLLNDKYVLSKQEKEINIQEVRSIAE